MTAPAITKDRIGDLLVREGLITRDQLNRALYEQEQTGTRVGFNLVKLGYVKETDITRMLARQHRMPAVDLSRFEVDSRVARLIPSELAIKQQVLPLKREGRTLTVAISDPTKLGVLDDLKFITRLDIFPVIAGEYTLHNAIENFYESADSQMASLLENIVEESEQIEVVETEEEMSATAAEVALDDAPVVKLINAILIDAVRKGASDIHLECFEHELRVRYRIDGALQEIMRPPYKMRPALIAATLAANYGIYGPAFELMQHRPREPGSEEYLDSEKYEIRNWDLAHPDSLAEFIGRLNAARRDNPALQRDWSLRFFAVEHLTQTGRELFRQAGLWEKRGEPVALRAFSPGALNVAAHHDHRNVARARVLLQLLKKVPSVVVARRPIGHDNVRA